MKPVRLYCTGRKTHDPVTVLAYSGKVPIPERWAWSPSPSSVLELLCDRRSGGCGRSPRPGDTPLRKLVEAVADTPSREFDISYWNL
jgi:hypothetical protein